MDRLFSPCARYRDMLEGQGRLEVFRSRCTETLQELNLDVSTEELLSAEREFTYLDLYTMSGNQNTVLWLTPSAAVICFIDASVLSFCMQLEESRLFFTFRADGKEIYASAHSPEHLLEICDVVLLLLAASVVHSVHLLKSSSPIVLINAPTLAYLMEQCQSLKVLSFDNLKLDEDLCHTLGAYSRPELNIELKNCRITGAAATVLAQVLRRNRGPTVLDLCYIDYSVLANGMRGNSRLKCLTLRVFNSSPVDGNRQILAMAGALKENKGLVDLNISHDFSRTSDETWDAVCDSLKMHPALQVFDRLYRLYRLYRLNRLYRLTHTRRRSLNGLQ